MFCSLKARPTPTSFSRFDWWIIESMIGFGCVCSDLHHFKLTRYFTPVVQWHHPASCCCCWRFVCKLHFCNVLTTFRLCCPCQRTHWCWCWHQPNWYSGIAKLCGRRDTIWIRMLHVQVKHTPLHNATFFGRVEISTYLLEAGCETNLKDIVWWVVHLWLLFLSNSSHFF